VAGAGRPSWGQLALECAQRELTYLPIAASCMLVYFLPAWPPTWVIAPVLFTAGGAHFIYDLLMGQEVRASLAARQERTAESARDAELAEQNRRSEALNAELNRRNAEIVARNAAARAEYERALAAYERARAEYEARLAAHRAEEEAYRRAQADWEARVAACRAGDYARCAVP